MPKVEAPLYFTFDHQITVLKIFEVLSCFNEGSCFYCDNCNKSVFFYFFVGISSSLTRLYS